MADDAPTIAIATACDEGFLWGTLLLLGSLQRYGVTTDVATHVLTSGIGQRGQELLAQFDNVRVHESTADTGAPAQLMKPEAILAAGSSESITWLDADCMVSGDIRPSLVTSPGKIVIRFRGGPESQQRFSGYRFGDSWIPDEVLAIWREDVGERMEAAIDTTCASNVITLHRQDLRFVERWEEQLKRCLAAPPARLHAAYHASGAGLSDELVLNSLFAFSENPPSIQEYRLDKEPRALVVHFVGKPKPWDGWTAAAITHYELVVSTLEWLEENGYRTPPVPPSLHRRNLAAFALRARVARLRAAALAPLASYVRRRRRAKWLRQV